MIEGIIGSIIWTDHIPHGTSGNYSTRCSEVWCDNSCCSTIIIICIDIYNTYIPTHLYGMYVRVLCCARWCYTKYTYFVKNNGCPSPSFSPDTRHIQYMPFLSRYRVSTLIRARSGSPCSRRNFSLLYHNNIHYTIITILISAHTHTHIYTRVLAATTPNEGFVQTTTRWRIICWLRRWCDDDVSWTRVSGGKPGARAYSTSTTQRVSTHALLLTPAPPPKEKTVDY